MPDRPETCSYDVEVSLSRDLGLAEVLMIGLGPNIGSSIFLLIGIATNIVGPGLLIAFILNFVVTLFTAMSYAELSSGFPETGGGYLWIKEGLFAPLGFLGGWMSWVGHCIACSVYAIGFGKGTVLLMEQASVPLDAVGAGTVEALLTASIAVFFCYINYRGVKGVGRSETLISAFLIGIIVLFIAFCLLFVITDPAAPGAAGLGPELLPFGYLSIATSMGFTFMIFEGYEVVAQTGEEARDPKRTVPRAMFMCIAISAVLFIAVAAVAFGTLGWEATAAGREAALVIAAERAVPLVGGALISAGMMIGSVAAVNSIVFSASRVSYAMGRDGNLPALFGRLHAVKHTPYAAIAASGAIIVVMAVALDIEKVAAVADVMILLLFVLVNIAAINLRCSRPDAERSFLTPFFPLVPVVGVITKLFLAAMLFTLDTLAWYVAIVVIFAGLLIHYFAQAREGAEKIRVHARAPPTAEERKLFRVLVPVDDLGNEGLIDMAAILAARRGGELLLINVIEVPMSLPLSAIARKRVAERRKMLEGLQCHAEMKGVRTRAIVIVSRDVVTSIISTAVSEAADAIMLGWKGYTRTQRRILGRKTDDIIRRTPCDIMVLRSKGRLVPDDILVLAGGGINAVRAAEAAADIAAYEGSRVTILNVVMNERHLIKAGERAVRMRNRIARSKVPTKVKDIIPESYLSGVVAETLEYDLLVMGSSETRPWDPYAFGRVLDFIARKAKCPVLMYKRALPREDIRPSHPAAPPAGPPSRKVSSPRRWLGGLLPPRRARP